MFSEVTVGVQIKVTTALQFSYYSWINFPMKIIKSIENKFNFMSTDKE